MNATTKWIFFGTLFLCAMVYLFVPREPRVPAGVSNTSANSWVLEEFDVVEPQPLSRFTEDLKGEKVETVYIDAAHNRSLIYLKSGSAYKVGGVLADLDEENRKLLSTVYYEYIMDPYYAESYRAAPPAEGFGWFGTTMLVLLGILALLYFLSKMGAKGQAGNIFALGKSKARVFENYNDVSFNDVGGCREAKEELRDIIDFLHNPERWTKAGARLPRGVLLEGPPGCGKTLLARAVAGEAKAKFFLVSASEFVEMFVGVGAARVRDMFEQALKSAPAIIFIDELDAVGRKRGTGTGVSNDEREQTLNQLLVCLDGFVPNDRVAVLAATNRADILDQALLRPGRFDRRLSIPLPDREGRMEIFKIHAQKCPLDDEVSLASLADRTAGYNGAEIENLVNEAVLLAVRRTRQNSDEPLWVTAADFDRAFDKRRQDDPRFDKVDAVLHESTNQLAQPTGVARIRIVLKGGSTLEGEVIWMDSAMIKIRLSDGADRIVSKFQVLHMESLPGTEPESIDGIASADWAVGQVVD